MIALSYWRSLRRDIAFWLGEGLYPLPVSFRTIEYVPVYCLVLVGFVRAIDCLVLVGSDLQLQTLHPQCVRWWLCHTLNDRTYTGYNNLI